MCASGLLKKVSAQILHRPVKARLLLRTRWFEKRKNLYIRISYEDFLKSVDTIPVQNSTATIEGESGSLEQYRDMIKDKNRTGSFPFNLDLSNLDTGSITNILNDIEQHLPLMESEGDLCQLLKVKAFFEDELKVSHRLH